VTGTSPPVSFLRNKRLFTALAAVLVFGLSLFGANVVSIEQFRLQLGTLSGKAWKAEGVQLKVRWQDDQGSRFTLSAARLTHAVLPFPLISPEIHCDRGDISDRLVGCEQGRLKLGNPLLDNDVFPVAFKWQKAEGNFFLALDQVGLAGGSLKLRFEGALPDWKLVVSGRNISLQRLRAPLSLLGLKLPEFKLQGRTNGDLNLVGGASLKSADWSLSLIQAAFSDSSGSYIGEGLNGDWQGKLGTTRTGYNGSTRLSLRQGALLTPFIYLEPDGGAINIGANYRLDTALSNLVFSRLEYRDPKLVALSAEGEIDLTPELRMVRLKLRSQPLEVGRVYSKYFQPVLADEFFQTLSLRGGARFAFELDAISRLNLELDDVAISQGGAREDRGGENFRLSGVEGKLFWSSDDSVPRSKLRWRDGALLHKFIIGAGEALLKLKGNAVQLHEPVSIPILDGELRAERFSINQAKRGSRVDFQGYITPISMKLVSEALGWPPLAGQLSAMIPGVSFEDGLLKLRGMTLVRAFDGNILLKNLQLDDLLGSFPVLLADVELKSLDLETLTSTFSFGKITGRLGGQINGLRLEQWQPVAFDAWFATPENDPGPHRISQKAVDNISNLGGMGISGALSRSYLRFFEEFGYEKLGISCRLENRICDMGGIESASQGYYLVKGGGLPRIDIVGFNRKTDWGVLLEKLKQVAEGEGPIIQ